MFVYDKYVRDSKEHLKQCIIFLIVLFLATNCYAKSMEELSLKESLKEMMILVEQDNTKEFFENWMDPRLYQPVKDSENVKALIANGFGNMKPQMLKLLNVAYTQAPNQDNYLDIKDGFVHFAVDKKDVKFRKVHGRWRFASK